MNWKTCNDVGYPIGTSIFMFCGNHSVSGDIFVRQEMSFHIFAHPQFCWSRGMCYFKHSRTKAPKIPSARFFIANPKIIQANLLLWNTLKYKPEKPWFSSFRIEISSWLAQVVGASFPQALGRVEKAKAKAKMTKPSRALRFLEKPWQAIWS